MDTRNTNSKGKKMTNGTTKTTNKTEGEICRHATKAAALCAARINQRRLGRNCYVVNYVTATDAGWMVTTRMPLMSGEWYSTDGIRHG